MSKTPQSPPRAARKSQTATSARLRNIASSTAIETGESVKAVEKKILRLRAARKRAPLA